MARRAAAVLVALVALAPAACGAGGDDEDARGGDVVAEAGDGVRSEAVELRVVERTLAGLRTLVLRPAGPGRWPVVAFVHGAGAPPEYYRNVLEPIAAAGHVVVAPAMPGSVDDSGPGALLALPFQPGRLHQVLDVLASGPEALPRADVERLVVMGHSLGAMTALAAGFHSCCRDRRVDAVVSYAGQPATFPGGEYVTGSVPVLLVHGTEDDVVPYGGGRAAFATVGTSARLLTVLGGDHGSYLDPGSDDFTTVVEATLAFLLATVGDDPRAGLADLRTAVRADGVRLATRT